MPSQKWRQFGLGLNVLISLYRGTERCSHITIGPNIFGDMSLGKFNMYAMIEKAVFALLINSGT